MANADAPFGFRPINRDGGPYNGATLRCVVTASDATALFIGDAVDLAGTSSEGYPAITQADTGEPVFGVVTAFEVNPDDLGAQYRKASTKRFCQVVVARGGQYFEVQSDDDTTALAEASVGLNCAFVQTNTGDTVYGISGMELNSDGADTTTTLDCQIVGLVDRPDNLLSGTGSTNKNAIIQFNVPESAAHRQGV
jgi:hypothetical protein